MLSAFVAFMQISYLLVLFTFVPVMLVLRVLHVQKEPLSPFLRFLYIVDITSLSYFLMSKKGCRTYNILLLIYGVFAFFALAFGLHIYF